MLILTYLKTLDLGEEVNQAICERDSAQSTVG